MRLTKQTGHAIRILIDCAQSGTTLIKVAGISDRLDITKQNVFKIVHILSRAGFISAVRGPSGGVRLAKPAQDIRIGDVVRAIEVTDVEIDGERDAAHGRPQGQASINRVFDDALMAFVSVLDQHTLADLVQQKLATPKRAASTPAVKRPKPAPGKKTAGSPRR
jgi:Rrf2 family nitric oxide-sensitive transcriptional repressor